MSVVVISSSVVMGPPQWVPEDAKPFVTIIEFDVPRCTLTYGVAPCEAALGVTGDRKCYNSRATCQDLENFSPELLTYRFTKASAQIHRDDGRDVIPSVTVVRTTPQLIAPGVNLGQRESVTVTFEDHPHSDAGLDKYLGERDFDPFERGTFWGRFRARYPSLRGLPLRVYRGELGQALEDFETWHYVIETAAVTGSDYVIVAKDHLKLLDGDRAQAPPVSRGMLAAAIDDDDTELTLEPAGIGDVDYPASGKAAIGGREIVSFTRSGDTLTLTGRGVSGTEATDHQEGDRVQVVLEYVSETAESIIYDLLTEYTEVDPAWINLEDWQLEVGTFVDQLYSAEIAEPTDVRKLINELIEQIGLIIWWDPHALRIRLTALRPVASDARVVSEEEMVTGTYSAREQPEKRVSEVWTYFNLRNPLERIDEPNNFASIAVSIDEDADPNEPPAIRKIFSRWIGFGNLAAALRLNGLILSRYSQPPRLFRYELYRGTEIPPLGRGSRITHRSLQDDTGAEINRPVQIVSIEPEYDRTRIQAEEMLFGAHPDFGDKRLIVIDQNSLNINLRTLHDSFYQAPENGDEVLCIIETDVIVGSADTSLPAFDVGTWPAGVSIELVIRGSIQGRGGRGGDGGFPGGVVATNGGDGGTALFARYAITIDNTDGEIGGGGGGGGGGDGFIDFDNTPRPGGGGGGGQGYLPGANGVGAGLDGAPGGGLGEAGSAPFPGSTTGGAAGNAVDGDSFVTFNPEGTILGPRVN